MTATERRAAERRSTRERLTAFYATFNRVVTGRGGADELAPILEADIVWTDATTGDRAGRTETGIDAVLENVVLATGQRAAHLQALPERFVDAGERTIVTGAYVGTIDGRPFDVPFAHAFAVRDGRIRRWTAYSDPALERSVFDA
ncbi:nuclear transport factor 2 family protein [Natrinema pallidum]|uniref:SnoaL-like domain-containing protein n=2 Tax=Natrinema pallidum TaxID=69527 RepID=L9YL04_9EURY|nr:nuclear transport factor 2 family protein [Natrinema pallidum]ELY74814.1 hypothetical protein C487_14209 [Natrinema pallidum DSM 3751]QCW04416.1 nuclear transport factor 2 family protein [Natrinema pallidum]